MVRAISQERTITAEVTGTDRYKYFRRPVTETKDRSPAVTATRFPLLGLENVTSLGLLAPPTTAQKPPTRHAAKQVRGTQTDYRESEAQTIPWTPPYTPRGDSTPEVLYLNQLSWGDGLPPGRHEVDIVERLRRKRAWESHLPPLDCQENINIRYKLITEMEQSDWQFREKEIEAIHEERMKKSEQLLEEHNLMNRSRLTCRMEYLEDDINKRKERKLQLIRHEKERALRKLYMREKGYDPKKYKMSVLEQHLRHTSELYAPMRRYGISFKNRHETLAQKRFTIDDQDICDFEYTPNYRPVFDYNKASQPKRQTDLCVRETRWTMENLINLHRDLQQLRSKSSRVDTFYSHLEQRIKPSGRTMATVLPSSQRSLSDEHLYQAAIMIQRVVHNRSMQALMEQKRDCWKELMGELKRLRVESSVDTREDNVMRARLDGVLSSLIGLNVGTSIGQTLHHLATELLKFKNEGIAHSQALQAEAARWRRELPEEGRRQREMRRREEHNLMFAQLLEVYQESINGFLEGLVAQARENEAKLQAYDHAKEVAWLAEQERLNRPPPLPEEPISADLLFELIAPEGLRELARTCMLILKQKYQQARQCLVELGQAEPLSDKIDQEETEVDKTSMDQRSYSDGNVGTVPEQIGDPSDSVKEPLEWLQSLSSTSTGKELSVPISSGSASAPSTSSAVEPVPIEAREPLRWVKCIPDIFTGKELLVPIRSGSVQFEIQESLKSVASVPSTSTVEEPSVHTRSGSVHIERREPLKWGQCVPDIFTGRELSVLSSGSVQFGVKESLKSICTKSGSVTTVPATSTGTEPSSHTRSGSVHIESLDLDSTARDLSTQASSAQPSFIYSEVSEKMGSLLTPGPQWQCGTFGLLRAEAPAPETAEERLLARVMRDMCYVAGSLLHTAANILNKALSLAGIPQESFDEALRRTMLVINGALEEVIGLILPKKPEEKQPISEEIIAEASKIVDEILEKAKQRIAEMKEKDLLKMDLLDRETQAKSLVEDVIKEAQQKVLRMIVEDFLTDLFQEATMSSRINEPTKE